MPVDNARFVFDPGNQWTKEKDAGPYYGLPAAWRRFIFQILSNREFAVYAYVCSVMDPNAVAYPTPEQIAEDMGIRTRSVIVDALSSLVTYGFLLSGPEPRPGRMGRRTIYQRPLPHYTLWKLLDLKKIDANLFPTNNQRRDIDLTKASDDIVRASLQKLLGDKIYHAYSVLRDPDRRERLLTTALKDHVTKAVEARSEELATKRRQTDVAKLTGEIPDWLRELIAEEHPTAAAAIKTPF